MPALFAFRPLALLDLVPAPLPLVPLELVPVPLPLVLLDLVRAPVPLVPVDLVPVPLVPVERAPDIEHTKGTASALIFQEDQARN